MNLNASGLHTVSSLRLQADLGLPTLPGRTLRAEGQAATGLHSELTTASPAPAAQEVAVTGVIDTVDSETLRPTSLASRQELAADACTSLVEGRRSTSRPDLDPSLGIDAKRLDEANKTKVNKEPSTARQGLPDATARSIVAEPRAAGREGHALYAANYAGPMMAVHFLMLYGATLGSVAAGTSEPHARGAQPIALGMTSMVGGLFCVAVITFIYGSVNYIHSKQVLLPPLDRPTSVRFRYAPLLLTAVGTLTLAGVLGAAIGSTRWNVQRIAAGALAGVVIGLSAIPISYTCYILKYVTKLANIEGDIDEMLQRV